MITKITAPKELDTPGISVFLAGGISNCPDWQSECITMIQKYNFQKDIVLYNPRRLNFVFSLENSEIQIQWEFQHLKKADVIIFWFSEGSLNPIVLYELGMWGNSRDKQIIIGVHPRYERKEDVIIQTKLARPDIEIAYTLDEVVKNLFIMEEFLN